MLRKTVASLLVFALAMCLAGCGGNREYVIITGDESGTYYSFGEAIAEHFSETTGHTLNVLPGIGSVSNIEAITSGEADFALCQSDVMAYAHGGINLFTSPVKGFSTVAALYTEQLQIITLRSDITSVLDLKGKRVSVGEKETGTYFNALDVLGVYGLTIDDIDPEYKSFGDAAEALKDGTLDAAFVVAGAPTKAVSKLAASNDIYLVPLDDELINKLLAVSPYYVKSRIDADMYGTGEEIATVGVGAVLIASDKVPRDVVYDLVSDIFSDSAAHVGAHPKYAELRLDFAASVAGVPYHKGAVKFFKENDWVVPAK